MTDGILTAHHAEGRCKSCGELVLCERNEDGEPDLDTVPCQGSDDCTATLCVKCRRQCWICDLYACAAHASLLPNGQYICDLCNDNLKDEPYDH